MDKKTKAFLICFTIISFIAVAAAETYTNRADALADLGKIIPQPFEKGECEIITVNETIKLGETEGQVKVNFILTYILDGEETGEEYDVNVTSTDDPKDIEKKIEEICEEKLAKIASQALIKRITQVYIDYTQGALKILQGRTYDSITKTWSG